MLTIVFGIAIIILVTFVIVLMVREAKSEKLAKLKAQKTYDSLPQAEKDKIAFEKMTPDEQDQWTLDHMTASEKAEYDRKKEQEQKYFSGKYVGGHPDIISQIPETNAEVNDTEIIIYSVLNRDELWPTAGKIPIESITNVKIPIESITNVVVEDASTVEKRITATRLLAIGVFALAAKKNEVHPEFYVTITWGTGKIPNDTIFEFDGMYANTNANLLRNIIAKRVNASATT